VYKEASTASVKRIKHNQFYLTGVPTAAPTAQEYPFYQAEYLLSTYSYLPISTKIGKQR
jgi:hypothetical protein